MRKRQDDSAKRSVRRRRGVAPGLSFKQETCVRFTPPVFVGLGVQVSRLGLSGRLA